MWNNHTSKSLPCINLQQVAAKIILKDQQALILFTFIKFVGMSDLAHTIDELELINF